MKDIAVIIPLYNGAKWIQTTLESVFNQSYTPSEIIVVDNNSTDNSLEIISQFKNVQLINNSIQGPNFSRQCGLQASKASLIAYLDQDDVWHPNHLKYLYDLLSEYPDYPAAVASSIIFRSIKLLSFSVANSKKFDYNPWSIFPANKITTPSSLMIRRTALEAIGGWPTKFNFCGDLYTWLRLSVHHPLIHHTAVTVGYRKHSNSQSASAISSNTQNCFDSKFKVLEDALSYYPKVPESNYAKLEKRLLALSALRNILANIVDFNSSQLTQSINLFEECLSEEDYWFIRSICGTLMWFLYDHLATEPFLLGRLLKAWPKEAKKTSQAFSSLIASSRILPKRLLLEPFNSELWLFMLKNSQEIFHKISSRIKYEFKSKNL